MGTKKWSLKIWTIIKEIHTPIINLQLVKILNGSTPCEIQEKDFSELGRDNVELEKSILFALSFANRSPLKGNFYIDLRTIINGFIKMMFPLIVYLSFLKFTIILTVFLFTFKEMWSNYLA